MLFTRSKQNYQNIKKNVSVVKQQPLLFNRSIKYKNTHHNIIKNQQVINYNTNKSKIPLHVYQTWFTKKLPKHMQNNIDYMKKINPEFTFHLYDDKDCRDFIEKYFDRVVVNAFDKLKPGAYKADLWRLCIMYIHGGIYLDIKLLCVNGFKLCYLTDGEHYVKDRDKPLSIYNALMVCLKNNSFIYECIQKICFNVMTDYYGKSSLSITGPILLGETIIQKKYQLPIDLIHKRNNNNDGFIIYNEKIIMRTEYPEYFKERTECYKKIHTKRYKQLWDEKNIYN